MLSQNSQYLSPAVEADSNGERNEDDENGYNSRAEWIQDIEKC